MLAERAKYGQIKLRCPMHALFELAAAAKQEKIAGWR
jgi:hypothetical protein